MIVDTPLHILLETYRLNANADMRAELQKIQVPALIIHGDQDGSAPIDLTGRKTAELIPGASLTVYPGAGHGLYASDHETLNADLLAFIGTAALSERTRCHRLPLPLQRVGRERCPALDRERAAVAGDFEGAVPAEVRGQHQGGVIRRPAEQVPPG
jgi:TAP-like protein